MAYLTPTGRTSNFAYVYPGTGERVSKGDYVEVIEPVETDYNRNLFRIVRGNGTDRKNPGIWILNANGKEVLTKCKNLRKSTQSERENYQHFAWIENPEGVGDYRGNAVGVNRKKRLSGLSEAALTQIESLLRAMRLENCDVDDVSAFIREKNQRQKEPKKEKKEEEKEEEEQWLFKKEKKKEKKEEKEE